MSHPLPWSRERVEALIPHRDPFLFVDEVVAREEDGLTGRWTIPADAAWFAGHYPGQPVQPGALTCEHAFQVAAVHVSDALGGLSPEDGVPVLTRIEAARFKRVVGPGDVLETSVKVEERLGPAWFLSAVVRCEGKKVVTLRFALTATEALARAAGEPGAGGGDA